MLRAIAFQTLLLLRGVVRLPLRLLMLASAIIIVVKLAMTGFQYPVALVLPASIFVGSALLRHYYDVWLLHFAPEGQSLYLPH